MDQNEALRDSMAVPLASAAILAALS